VKGGGSLYNLITNELQKIFKKRKVLIIMILFSAITVLFSILQYQSQHKTPMQTIVEDEKLISTYKSVLPYENASEAKQVKQAINMYKDNIKKAYKQQDLKKLSFKDQINSLIADDEKKKNSADLAGDNTKIEGVNKDILVMKYALKNNITEAADSSNVKAIDIFTQMIDVLSIIILPVIICIIVLDVVSSETSPPTMKMLLTKPRSRGKILFSKFSAASIASIVAIIGSEIISFIILGIIIGFGRANSPVTIGTKYEFNGNKVLAGSWHDVQAVLGSSYAVPQWKFILEMILLQLVFIVAFTSICILVSAVAGSNTISMTAGIVVAVILSFMIIKISSGDGSSAGDVPIRQIAPYIINTYASPGLMLRGDLSQMIRNPDISLTLGIAVNVITGVISYVLAHLWFTKKDMLV